MADTRIARAAQALKGEAAYEVLSAARALERDGTSVVHLEIGQPDFKTPQPIIDEAIASLSRGETGYAPTLGLPELRAAIANRESARRGRIIDPQNVVVTPGAKTAIFLGMAALVNPGDEVIYPDPGFPAYESITRYLGGVPRPLPIIEAKNFSFDRDAFADLVNEKTKLVILNSPSNPTGGVIPPEDLAFVAELARKHNFFVLSDEIYDELSFERASVSIAEMEDMQSHTFIVNGFSKTYAMPGWRLGYIVVPEGYRAIMDLLAVNLFSCTATFIQRAGVVAITNTSDIEGMRVQYKERRDYLVAALNEIPGVSCKTPGGAFYVFPNVTSFNRSAKDIADHLLSKAGVAVLPGTAFGQCGEGYLRLSYATSLPLLQEAVARIKNGLASL